jgi:hypothetical protein
MLWAESEKLLRRLGEFDPEARSRQEAMISARRLPFAVQAGKDLGDLKEIEAAQAFYLHQRAVSRRK